MRELLYLAAGPNAALVTTHTLSAQFAYAADDETIDHTVSFENSESANAGRSYLRRVIPC